MLPKSCSASSSIFAGGRAPQQAHVENDDVAAAGFDAIEHVAQVIEVVKVADGHENVARTRSDGFWRQFTFHFEVELVHLDVLGVPRG